MGGLTEDRQSKQAHLLNSLDEFKNFQGTYASRYDAFF